MVYQLVLLAALTLQALATELVYVPVNRTALLLSCKTSSTYPDRGTIGFCACPIGQLASGLSCTGPECQDVGLGCARYPGFNGSEASTINTNLPSSRTHPAYNNVTSGITRRISDETNQNWYTCPAGNIVAGISCAETNCGNLFVYCAPVKGNNPFDFRVSTQGCRWTPFTDDAAGGKQECGVNEVMKGVRCLGNNCARVSAECCPFRALADFHTIQSPNTANTPTFNSTQNMTALFEDFLRKYQKSQSPQILKWNGTAVDQQFIVTMLNNTAPQCATSAWVPSICSPVKASVLCGGDGWQWLYRRVNANQDNCMVPELLDIGKCALPACGSSGANSSSVAFKGQEAYHPMCTTSSSTQIRPQNNLKLQTTPPQTPQTQSDSAKYQTAPGTSSFASPSSSNITSVSTSTSTSTNSTSEPCKY